MRHVRMVFSLAIFLPLSILSGKLEADEAKSKVTYQDHIQPIFREKCFSCHNPDKKSGGLDLTSYVTVMQGGSSGSVIEPGSPDASYLYQLVTHQSEPFMPPMSDPIPKPMQDLIKAWIEGGALENSGSKPVAAKKPKVSVAVSGPVLERPATVAVPGHIELEPVVVTKLPGTIKSLATSPWAPVAAVAGQKQVLLVHTQTLELLGILPFPEGVPFSLKFSRSGNLLLAGGGRGGAFGRAVAWDVHTGERLLEVGDELDAVLAADISSDQSLVALGGPQKIVRVYATKDGQLQFELRKHTDWVLSVEFSPDGVLLASGDRAGNLFVWEANTGREYLTLKGHTAAITGLSWRSDSNVLASCSEDGTVRLWELENGNQLKSWGAHGGGAASIEFTRDGLLVTTGRDRVTKLWNQEGAAQRNFDAFDDVGVSVTFCDETHRVLAADWQGTLRVWDAQDGKLLGTVVANPPSLASRIEEAQKLLTARQAELTARRSAAEEATTRWQQLAQELAAVIEAVSKATAEQKALLERQQQNSAELEKHKKMQADVMANRTTLQAVLPPLAEAVRLAHEASKAAPSDEQLKQLAGSAQTLLKQRQEQAAILEKQLQSLTESIAAMEKSQRDTMANLMKLNEQLKTYAAQQEQLAANVKMAEEKKLHAQAQVDDAQKLVSQAEQAVARWTAEKEFVERMRQLREKQATLEQHVSDVSAKVAELTEQLAPLQKQLDQSAAALAVLRAEWEKSRTAAEDSAKTVAAANEKKKQAEATVATLQQQEQQTMAAIAALGEAADKTRLAAEKSQDAELMAAVEGIKKVAERKQTELEKIRRELADAQKSVTEVIKQIADLQAAHQTVQKNAAEMEQRVAEAQKQHDELVKRIEAAKQTLADMQTRLQQLSAELDNVTAEIRSARG